MEEYFAGERTGFDLRMELDGTPFQREVWTELTRIPYGETISYGELARRVGRPRGIPRCGPGQRPQPHRHHCALPSRAGEHRHRRLWRRPHVQTCAARPRRCEHGIGCADGNGSECPQRFRPDGRVALVTGAGSGIGRATAEVLAGAGATVVCADINSATASETAGAILGQGGRAESAELDVVARRRSRDTRADHFNKHFDAYLGAMYSGVHDGAASGYIYSTNINPTIGVRYKF